MNDYEFRIRFREEKIFDILIKATVKLKVKREKHLEY